MTRKEFLEKLGIIATSVFAFKNLKSQSKSYTLEIDQDECTNCGACYGEFPDDFQEHEETAWFKSGCCCDSDGPRTHATHGSKHIADAMDGCPVEAIKEIG